MISREDSRHGRIILFTALPCITKSLVSPYYCNFIKYERSSFSADSDLLLGRECNQDALRPTCFPDSKVKKILN